MKNNISIVSIGLVFFLLHANCVAEVKTNNANSSTMIEQRVLQKLSDEFGTKMSLVDYVSAPNGKFAVVFLASKDSFQKGFASAKKLSYVERMFVLDIKENKWREAKFVIDDIGSATKYLFRDIWSKDGRWIVFPKSDMGFVVMKEARLRDWIVGKKVPSSEVNSKLYGPHREHPGKVHQFLNWDSDGFVFSGACCRTDFTYKYFVKSHKVTLLKEKKE